MRTSSTTQGARSPSEPPSGWTSSPGCMSSGEDRYGTGPAQLDNLAYSLRIKLRGQRLGLKAVVAEGHDLVIRVDPQRYLDVDELARRFAGRIAIAPNRIKMRRQGEGWRDD